MKKSRKKKSIIWKVSKEILLKYIKESSSTQELLAHFGFTSKGSNTRTLKARLDNDNIILNWPKKKRIYRPSRKLEEILSNGSEVGSSALKKRLFKENLIKNICYICKQLPMWNNKVLVLQLDHINGISNDNRIENLRILCPHCHSQTDNFAGKNRKIKRQPKIKQPRIKKQKPPPKIRKNRRPLQIELEKLVWEQPCTNVAKLYNVTSKAVEKWCKYYGISKPPRGYWAKLKAKENNYNILGNRVAANPLTL